MGVKVVIISISTITVFVLATDTTFVKLITM